MPETKMNLDRDGLAYWQKALPEDIVVALGREITSAQAQTGRAVFRDAFAALPSLYLAVQHPALANVTRCAGPDTAVLQRALVFDKSDSDNWTLRWHQDRTIAVRRHHEVAGYSEWSEKDGVPHVHPPAQVLGTVLAVRIHIDDVDETNGALELLPGTHQEGIMPPERCKALMVQRRPHMVCAKAGDILLMRPLLLHRSKRSISPRSRRVIQLEFGGSPLPAPLEWHDAGFSKRVVTA